MYYEPDSIEINNRKFEKLYSFETLQARVEELAKRINRDYAGQTLEIVVVLTGAMPFAMELIKFLNLDVRVRTISAKSYGAAMESSGKVNIGSSDLKLLGENVLIVEDIVDSGRTMHTLTAKLRQNNPKSIEIATLFLKPKKLEFPVAAKYVGFEIGPEFVVGFGLDYNEQGRQYSAIYCLAD